MTTTALQHPLPLLPRVRYAATDPVTRVVNATWAWEQEVAAKTKRYAVQKDATHVCVYDRHAEAVVTEQVSAKGEFVPIRVGRGADKSGRAYVERRCAELNALDREETPHALKAMWAALTHAQTIAANTRLVHLREGELDPALVRTGPRYLTVGTERIEWPANLISLEPHPRFAGYVLAVILCPQCDQPVPGLYRSDNRTVCSGEYGAIRTAQNTRHCALCRNPQPAAVCVDRVADLPDQDGGVDGIGEEPRVWDDGGDL